ncbi:MAG: hypothetical protein IVW36_11100 [Dehalococcoidia bacterium]|nr:hypothetical protein [Dehalococcoidia bacterium]
MPKQNRPLMRDGRLQSKKKRTDRAYLRPGGARTTVIDDAPGSDPASDRGAAANGAVPVSDAEPTMAELASEAADSAAAVATRSSKGSAAAPAGAASGRLPSTVRAMQQQGVRKRREFDVHALAVRDTQYAFHELRRIFVLATAVIITLIVLGFVLR